MKTIRRVLVMSHKKPKGTLSPRGGAYKSNVSSWMTKDDVSRTLRQIHREFNIGDSNTTLAASWQLDDESAPPPLPDWRVLLHEDIYRREKEQTEAVAKKYVGISLMRDEGRLPASAPATSQARSKVTRSTTSPSMTERGHSTEDVQ